LITDAPISSPVNMQNNLILNVCDRFITINLNFTSTISKSAPIIKKPVSREPAPEFLAGLWIFFQKCMYFKTISMERARLYSAYMAPGSILGYFKNKRLFF
jgi:hypothetical protein